MAPGKMLTPEQLHDAAYVTVACARSMLNEEYRNPNKLVAEIIDAKANAAGDAVIPIVRAAYGLTYAESEQIRLEQLRPFLTEIREVIPLARVPGRYEENGSSEVEALHDITEQLMKEGKLEQYYVAQPAVEHWVEETARHAADLLLNVPETMRGDGRKLLETLIGVTYATRELLNGVTAWFREFAPELKEQQAVSAVIADIRLATYFTMLRQLMSPTADPPEEFPEIFDRYMTMNIREKQMKDKTQENHKHCIAKMHNDRDDIKKACKVLVRSAAIPELTEALQRALPLEKPIDPAYQRVLPPGLMTMVWTATTDGDKPLYYTTNGTNHFSHIGMHSPEQPPEDESESSDPERYTFGQFAGCKIDTAGKPFIDEHIDRFAPAPMNAQWAYSSGMLQRADAVLNKELIDLWDEYPQIIGDLMTLGPVIFVNGVHLLFRSTVAKEIATRVRANVNPPEATALIAKQAKIDLHGEWSSITVRAEETDDDETEVDRVFEKSADAERRHMRALIRKSVGKRVPSLDWIEKHLSALGTVHTKKRKGGTSHQWITLTRNGETHKYSTSPSIRSTDSLDFKILWSVLHTLRISAEEFYEECRRDKVS